MIDDKTKLLLKKSGTKKEFRKICNKQRHRVLFNTGSRKHDDKTKYHRHSKHRKVDYENF